MAQPWPGNATQINISKRLINICFFIVIVLWNSYLHDDYMTTILNMFRHWERERCWKQGCQLGMIVILTFKSSWIFFSHHLKQQLLWPWCWSVLWLTRAGYCMWCRVWTYLSCFTILLCSTVFVLKMLRLLDTRKSRYRLFCAWPPGREVVSQVWSVDTGEWKQHNLLSPMCIV